MSDTPAPAGTPEPDPPSQTPDDGSATPAASPTTPAASPSGVPYPAEGGVPPATEYAQDPVVEQRAAYEQPAAWAQGPAPDYGRQTPYAPAPTGSPVPYPEYPAPPALPYGQPQQSSAPPGAYGGPGYPVPAPSYSAYPPARPTNVLAIVSLICSLAGFATGLSAVAGVVCGHIALSQIKRTGEQGRGMAIAGLAVGYALIAMGVLAILAWIAFMISIAAIAPYELRT